MIYFPNRITPPTIEPITVADLEGAGHLRIPDSSQDTILAAYITAAREYVEWRTGRTLFTTTWEEVRDAFPAGRVLRLRRAAPLASVTWVRYTDTSGAVTTWGAANYLVNTDAMPGFITPVYGGSWPSAALAEHGAVRVRFVAGLNSSASPLVYPDEALMQAIRLLVGGFYENRESEILASAASQQTIAMRYGVEALLSQYQVHYEF